MTSRPTFRIPFVLALALAACSDDEAAKPTPDTSAPIDVSTPDVLEEVAPDVAPDTAPEEVAVRANSFAYAADMTGSDGNACVASCAMKRLAGENAELAIVYRDADGRPIVDRQVYWDTGDAPTDLASLGAFTTYTDAQGRSAVSLRSGGLTGSLTVTAQVLGDDTVTSRPFVITFDAPPQPDLAASFDYLGSRPVAEFSLRLYKMTDGQPSCAAVHPDAPAIEPTLVAGPYMENQQARIQTLPGLGTDGEQRWTVQFIGPAATDGPTPPLAVGCVDNVVAKLGTTAQALVYVLDLPPHFRGTFQSITRIDTLSGGEGTTIGNMLLTLSEIFTQPGRLLVVWACANPSGVLSTVCGWITDSSGQPSSLFGSFVVDIVNAALLELLAEAIGDDFQDASQVISEILRDLRLVNTTTFANEPATPRAGFPGAYFAPGDASEEWTHVRFRWKFDPRCKDNPNPADCGWDQVPLEDIYGHRPSAQLDAGIDANAALHITPHAVPTLTYGPLINYLVERRIMPLVFAGGGDEPIDSWDDFVATLFGDRVCLDENDCCEWFAIKTEDSALGSLFSFESREAACELAVPLAAGLIRNQITRLDGALHLGTFSNAPCAGRDADSNRWVDGYGTQSNLCDWDLWFPASGQRFEPDNDWLSVRQ